MNLKLSKKPDRMFVPTTRKTKVPALLTRDQVYHIQAVFLLEEAGKAIQSARTDLVEKGKSLIAWTTMRQATELLCAAVTHHACSLRLRPCQGTSKTHIIPKTDRFYTEISRAMGRQIVCYRKPAHERLVTMLEDLELCVKLTHDAINGRNE